MKKMYLTLMAMFVLTTTASAQFYPDGRPIPPRLRKQYYANHPSTVITRSSSGYAYPSSSADAPYYYGFRIGMSMSNVHSDSPYLDANDMKVGLNAGAVMGMRLTRQSPLYFETGLYYIQKGGKSKSHGEKFTYNLDYLEVPLLLKYRCPLERDVFISPYVGGTLAAGVSGKIKDYEHREAFSSFEDGYFRRFDGGIRVGCDFTFQMLHLGINYDIGLSNIGQDDFDDTRNGCLNLEFGVTF